MEEVIAGPCIGAIVQTLFQPGFGAADSCGPRMSCEGEAVPADTIGGRTGTGGAVGFARDGG